jgi:type I restriction enzyme S subunit
MCKVKLQEYSEATAVPSVRKSKLEQITIHVPELIDQENIEQKLDTITSIIKIRQQQLTNLDTLIKARFVEMFGDVTETVPLSYYIESLTAGKSLAGEAECQNKVLKTGAATYDYFDPAQIKNLPTDYEPLPEHQIHDGDVIISRMNTLELVGASAYVWKAPDNTYLPDRLWKAIISDKANPIFVWQSIIQPTSKEAIRKIAGGTSGSMKNISKQGLLNLHVKLVDIDQQNEFAAFVSQIDKSKAVVQAALDKAQLLFDSLMQQYFG